MKTNVCSEESYQQPLYQSRYRQTDTQCPVHHTAEEDSSQNWPSLPPLLIFCLFLGFYIASFHENPQRCCRLQRYTSVARS